VNAAGVKTDAVVDGATSLAYEEVAVDTASDATEAAAVGAS